LLLEEQVVHADGGLYMGVNNTWFFYLIADLQLPSIQVALGLLNEVCKLGGAFRRKHALPIVSITFT